MLVTGLYRETSFHLVWLVASWALCSRSQALATRLAWVGAFAAGFVCEYMLVRHFFPGPVSSTGGVLLDPRVLFLDESMLSLTNLCSVGLAALFPVACLLRVRDIPRTDWRRGFFTVNAWVFPAGSILSDDERQPGGIQNVVPGAAAVHLRDRLRRGAFSVRNKPIQRVGRLMGESSQLSVDLRGLHALRNRNHQPHQRTVRPVARQPVPEDVPADHILVGYAAIAFQEPVVDELRLPPCSITTRFTEAAVPEVRQRVGSKARPSSRRRAGTVSANELTSGFALGLVVGNIEVDGRRSGPGSSS